MKVGFALPFIASVCGDVHTNYVPHCTCMENEDKAINIGLYTALFT